MDKENEKDTMVTFSALCEKNITPLQLLQEIQPLLKEYFIGNFKIENSAITMRFFNGNKFRLTVGEVVKE